MKKCNECNCDMIEDCSIHAERPFKVGIEARVDISVRVPNGQQTSFLGLPIAGYDTYGLNARMCPKCGKIELYAELNR